MTMELSINVDNLVQALRERKANVTKLSQNGLKQGMRFFEGKMIKEQLSGRVMHYWGLNRVTGTLARSWRIDSQGENEEFKVRLSTSIPYARIHQFGGNTGKGGRTFIPKRLYIYEDFQKSGIELIKRSITTSLMGLKK